MKLKEHKMEILIEDVLGSSRWWRFWNFVIKKKHLKLSIALNPPSTEVYIDIIKVDIE